MSSLIGIVAFVFMLSFIVVIHEFGHFIVARLCGVHCHEFSIGMGPAIYQRQGKQTIFSVRAILLGGYVMMAGEDDGSQNEEKDEWLQKVKEEDRLYSKPAWQQVCILVAGVAMNILLAWVLFIGISMVQGYAIEEAKPLVHEVTENSPAQSAGILAGDRIVKAESKKDSMVPETQSDLLEFIQYHHDEVTLTIDRDGQEVVVTVDPVYNEEYEMYVIGITAISNVREIAWYESFKYGTIDLVDCTKSIFYSISMLFKGSNLDQLSGPVGIYSVTEQAASYGLLSYLYLIAMISLNIGIFNLLPIPALDGGRVLILLFEKIFNRKINKQIVAYIILASFLLLFGVMIYATYNDILRLL